MSRTLARAALLGAAVGFALAASSHQAEWTSRRDLPDGFEMTTVWTYAPVGFVALALCVGCVLVALRMRRGGRASWLRQGSAGAGALVLALLAVDVAEAGVTGRAPWEPFAGTLAALGGALALSLPFLVDASAERPA